MNIRKNPEVSISMKGFRPHGATLSRILAIGIPSVVMQSIGSVMTFLMNQILIAFSCHGGGGVRRVFQAPELCVHAGVRPEQRHGADCRRITSARARATA